MGKNKTENQTELTPRERFFQAVARGYAAKIEQAGHVCGREDCRAQMKFIMRNGTQTDRAEAVAFIYKHTPSGECFYEDQHEG